MVPSGMTTSKVSIISLLATFVISWVRLVHAESGFTPEDVKFIRNQEGLNPGLLPPKGNTPIGQLYATGAQHYTYNGTAWVLTNATATLINAHLQRVGIHYFLPRKDAKGGQPTWESDYPKSFLTGRPMFVVPQNNSISWVLLNATNSEGAAHLFGEVTYIQRLYTQKGLPPKSAPKKINATHSSPYSASYVYFVKLL